MQAGAVQVGTVNLLFRATDLPAMAAWALRHGPRSPTTGPPALPPPLRTATPDPGDLTSRPMALLPPPSSPAKLPSPDRPGPVARSRLQRVVPVPSAPAGLLVCSPLPPSPLPSDALEGKGPQRRPQKKQLGRRLEEVAKAVGGGYYWLQMPCCVGPSLWGCHDPPPIETQRQGANTAGLVDLREWRGAD